MTEFNKIQTIKRRFFAMRNGVIADILRRNGSPFRIIFGLNMPQIEEIARDLGKDKEIADALWANDSTRESKLLAPMLMVADDLSVGEIKQLIVQSQSVEIVDNLVHKLLRYRSDSLRLASDLAESDDRILRYAAMRMLWHHVYGESKSAVKELASKELGKGDVLTERPARQIIEEIDAVSEY